MPQRILILAPHADDEVLGCGGLIRKSVEAGTEVHIAILTNASVGAPEIFTPDAIDQVRQEALAAHQILGVTSSQFHELPAPQLDQYPQYKIARLIAQIIGEVKPHSLYIPHRGDLHLDHGAIFNAALVAARPAPGALVQSVYAYETLSETEWGHPFADRAFIPNHFVPLQPRHLELKLEAFLAFRSQVFPFPSSISASAERIS